MAGGDQGEQHRHRRRAGRRHGPALGRLLGVAPSEVSVRWVREMRGMRLGPPARCPFTISFLGGGFPQ